MIQENVILSTTDQRVKIKCTLCALEDITLNVFNI